MEDINVKVDLDLDDHKAKEKLEEFKNSVKNQDVKIKLDLSDIKGESNKVKKAFKEAFKIDSSNGLNDIEKRLKQINKLLKAQKEISKGTNGSFGIKINKNSDIIKDTKILVDDYKKATEQMKELDSFGKEMKSLLNTFNKEQETAFKKFKEESDKHSKYLESLTNDSISDELKKAIKAKKKQIDLESELLNLGVVKVNNDQLRNQTYDGSIFTIHNEKWKAMYAKTASEAKELEDMARKLQPQITRYKKSVAEKFEQLSTEDKELFNKISKAYSEKPKMDNVNLENSNLAYLKFILEASMSDIDKMGLNFEHIDDVFKGLNRYFTRLDQLQDEFNTKFANKDGFKSLKLESLKDMEDTDTKQAIEKIDNNNLLLEKAILERMKSLQKLSGKDDQVKPVNLTSGLDSTLKEYLSEVKKIESLNAQLHKAESQNKGDVVKALNEEIQAHQRKQLELTSTIRANNSLSESIKKIIIREEELARARTNTKNAITDNNNFEKQQSELSRLNSEYERYSNKLDEIEHKLSNMRNSKGFLDKGLIESTNNLLEKTKESLNANGIESDFKEINHAIKTLDSNLKDLNFGNTLSKQEASFNVAFQNMENRLKKFIDSIRDMRGSDEIIEKLTHEFQSINTSNIEKANADLREFGSTLNRVGHEYKEVAGGGFFSRFGQDFKENLFTFTAGELVADGIRNAFYGVKDVVMDLDSAFTDLKKVADPKDIMNVQQLDAISDKATNIAKNVGQSSGDVIRSIADTIQMTGKSMKESTIIAEQTMKLANVADMTQKQATEGVATMVSAFKLDAFKDIDIKVGNTTKKVNEMENAFDKLNYVGNNFSISSAGLVEALQAGGSVLATYGVSLTDTLSMITAANTTLQDPKRVGNGLKSIAVNLQGIKASADTGELSLNKTAKTLQEVAKIDIFADKKAGKIKDTSTLLDELGKKWKSFSDVEKAGISEAIAGKQQAAVFQSLMSNFETFKKAQAEMDAGKHFKSMQQENEKYVQSLSGQLNKLKETWIGIFNDLFDKRLLAGALQGIIAISEGIATLVSKLKEVGLLKPMLAGLFGFLAIKQGSKISQTVNEIKNVANSIKSLGKASSAVNEAAEVVDAGLNVIANSSANASSKVEASASKFSMAKSKIKEFRQEILPTADALPVLGGYALAASAGVYAIAKAYDYFNESTDEQLARTQKEVEVRRESVKNYEDQIKGLQDIQKEYDNLNNKQNKNADDLKRLKELSNQIAKIKPELKIGEDKDGNAIIALTGNVKDLISELKTAQKEQKMLLQDADYEDAKSQIRKRQNKKEVGGLEGGSQALGVTNTLNDMQKLEEATIWHKTKMENLEKDRNKAIEKMYNSTGKERKKAIKQLHEANVGIEKEQERFKKEYSGKLKEIEDNNKQIGDRLFNYLENGSRYANMSENLQKEFSGLKEVLDFSEVQTDEDLNKTQTALGQLLDSARMGKINLGDLKKSLSDANAEFQKTGDVKKYNETIDNLVEQVSKATNIDPDILTRIFKGLDTSPLKQGSDDLDKFLRKYGKTAKDLQKDDSFAKALAEQRLHIQSGLESIKDALDSEDFEYKKKVLIDLESDENLPKQLRDMISTLLDDGANENDVLEVAQAIMVDLEDGDIDIEKANKMIEEKFGKGKFQITPDITMSDKVKVKGVETVLKQLQERFNEVPTTVKTIIKTEGITAFNEAKELTEMYNKIPKEVRTSITNNGLESSKTVKLVDDLLRHLPPEVITNLINNYPDVIRQSTDYNNLLKNLPKEVVSKIVVNSDLTNVQVIKDAIEKLPVNKDVVVSVISGLATGNIDQVQNALNSLPPEKRLEVLATIEDALSGINTVEGKKLKDKITTLKSDPKLALQGIDQVNGKKMTPKNTKVTESGSSVVKKNLDKINNTQMKGKNTKVTENGASHVKSQLDGVNSRAKNKTVTITTIFKTIGNAVKGAAHWLTGGTIGAGGQAKPNKVNKKVVQRLSVANTPNPVPMATGQSTMSSSTPAPIPTSAPTLGGGVVLSSGDVVPSGYTTAAPISSSGISSGQIMPSFNFDIDLLSGMENELKRISNQLDIINIKAKHAFGSEKSRMLKEQNDLYRKQQSLQDELYKSMIKQQSVLKSHLKSSGISFSGDRMINDVDLMLKKQNEVKNLEKKVNADKDNKNNSLRNQYDSARESLDRLKKAISEYNNITFDKLPKTRSEWERLNSQIKATNVELLKSKYELSNIKVDIQIDKFDTGVKRVASQIAILNEEIENAFGRTKSMLLEKKLELLRSQQDEVRDLSRAYEEQSRVQAELLKSQGFIIDKNNQILNPERLQDFVGSDMYSYLKDQLNSYNDLVNDKIPKLSVNVWNLQGEIKKAYEDQLKVTKEIQDKITEVYKKDIEDRKKLIDEETKSKINAINKEKEAYKKSRKEIDYTNDLREQKKVIDDLQVDIDNASRDTSITGQKKLKELMDKMKEEQKKLQEMVQNKLDEEVNDNYDKQVDRLQEEADREKESLDTTFSDENIQKLVDEALKTGVFVDIDGNVKNLQSVMISFVNSTKDGMSALGGVIKHDLISNLELAKESFKDIADIYQNLSMERFYQDTTVLPRTSNFGNSANKSVTIQFNQPLVVADNVSKDTLPDLEAMIKKAQQDLTESIVKSIK